MWASILIGILSFWPLSWFSTPQYSLAICTIFKNEAPWFNEWITYHHEVLGVDHFYLYNNDSTDHYAEVLKPFIDQGVVELIEWSSNDPEHALEGPFMTTPWVAFQIGAYNDCLKKRALGRASWVAMIDVDEFIVPAKGVKAFHDLLHSAKKKGRGTLRLFWRVFGTSNVENLGEGELLTEKLTWRSRDDHPWNTLVKSIHQPQAVPFCIVHEAGKLHKKYRRKTLKPSQARIHHYWTRTAQFCAKKRHKVQSSEPEFFEPFHQVKDETILPYLSVLKN